jgi:hypothetical protein
VIKEFILKATDSSLIKVGRYIHDRSVGRKHHLHSVLWARATEESANYVDQYLNEVLVFEDITQIWDYCIQNISSHDKGVALEFGVYKGTSINYFAERLPKLQFYGFDSFDGLAEDWKGNSKKKGYFSLGGKLPKVKRNVSLVKGWFDKTLPDFIVTRLQGHDLALLHIDGDTYQAAAVVLDGLRNFIRPGLLILFDEYLGYPNWKNGEYLAWKQFCENSGVRYHYKAFCCEQALVEVI